MMLLEQGNAVAAISVQKGMPWLGADRDDQRLYAELPRPQFTKLRLDLALNRALAFGALQGSWQSTLGAQGSHDILPSVELLDLADSSAVRGFTVNSLASRTAWYWRNTVSLRLPGPGGSIWLPRIGMDGGRALLPVAGRNWQSLAGATAGASLVWHTAQLDLDYSRPLSSPQGLASEPRVVLVRMQLRY